MDGGAGKEMLKEELFNGYYIYCDVIRMGKDCTMAVYGGDSPHVGCAVMSAARPSLTGEGIGVTTSVLSAMGHKDDVIARMFAEAAAERWNCTVVCTCGIHVEGLTPEQLDIVREKCAGLLQRMLEQTDE